MTRATHVALLRGINVGGKHTLPMKDLVDIFLAVGCRDARTYIQSGNVIFQADAAVAERLPGLVSTRIAERFGYNVPVVVRSAEALNDVVRHNPFAASNAALDTLHVLFLADAPDARHVAALDPDRSPPDRFVVRGRDVYLHLPNGMARTKLTNAYVDATLKTITTARNWRTVTALQQLMNG